VNSYGLLGVKRDLDNIPIKPKQGKVPRAISETHLWKGASCPIGFVLHSGHQRGCADCPIDHGRTAIGALLCVLKNVPYTATGEHRHGPGSGLFDSAAYTAR